MRKAYSDIEQSAYDYLRKAEYYKHMITVYQLVIEHIRGKRIEWASFMSEKTARAFEEYEREQAAKRANCIAQLDRITATLERYGASYPDHAALLRQRYLDGITWESIADAMYYSLSYVHRLHRRALVSFGEWLSAARQPEEQEDQASGSPP